jgi:steroid 5-alpha reductase family enzyme
MAMIWNIFLSSGMIILLLMTLLWLISLALKNSSIVDIFWGAGFVIVAWLSFVKVSSGLLARQMLMVGLVTLWGMRLSIHILIRNRGKGEDFRYAAWREEHGFRWWWRSYLQVFLLQGSLMWIIAAPVLVAQHGAGPESLTWLDGLGVAFWAVGFVFETVGDWQLVRFKSEPSNKGKMLTAGLWHYTRHPNYFGDSLQWWGFYFIAAAAGGGWTIFSPLLMTYLLTRVSGVTLLERTMQTRPGYNEYIRKTPAFLPWFPKK